MKRFKYFKNVSISLILLVALFAVTLYMFAFVTHEVFLEKEDEVDQAIFNYLSAHVINDQLTGFMKVVTYFASATFLQIAYCLLVVLYLLRKHYRRAFEIAAIGFGGYLVNYFMKLSFRRVRPPDPLIDPLHNFSFPSGHATSGFIFYGLLVYLIWKTNAPTALKYVAGIFLILFGVLIGFSRVYLRVHYPSDVFAGFCVGFAWLLLSVWLMDGFKNRKAKWPGGAV